MTKKSLLCIMLMVLNSLYALFLIGEMDCFIGKFNFNAFYVPGAIFALLIFPLANLVLWRIKERIVWIDYTLIMMPLILWLLVIPGGSFTNFLFINFPIIWTVSLLYLFRFIDIFNSKNVYVLAFLLWLSITVILFAINYFIPILPE